MRSQTTLRRKREGDAPTQFTAQFACFTSTKVQMLTLEELRAWLSFLSFSLTLNLFLSLSISLSLSLSLSLCLPRVCLQAFCTQFTCFTSTNVQVLTREELCLGTVVPPSQYGPLSLCPHTSVSLSYLPLYMCPHTSIYVSCRHFSASLAIRHRKVPSKSVCRRSLSTRGPGCRSGRPPQM